jgi:hypothetical protein
MKRRSRTPISTKIEANKDKIYRASDIHDLASMIFPNKNATDLRVAFILIFLAIKYSRDHRMTTSELYVIRKEKVPEVSLKSLWKARATMARIGIITRRDQIYWQFSAKFGKSLYNLAEKVANLMAPKYCREQIDKEWYLLDHARVYLKKSPESV